MEGHLAAKSCAGQPVISQENSFETARYEDVPLLLRFDKVRGFRDTKGDSVLPVLIASHPLYLSIYRTSRVR